MAGYDFSRLKILVADDSEFMRSLFKAMLRAFRVGETRFCDTGMKAFEELTVFQPDLALVDWILPDIQGPELVRLFRDEDASANPFIPIIMVTGCTEREQVIEACNAGIHHFLAKPVAAETLYRRMAALVEQPKPFVRTTHYFGPDRRHGIGGWGGGERRQNTQAPGTPGGDAASDPDDDTRWEID